MEKTSLFSCSRPVRESISGCEHEFHKTRASGNWQEDGGDGEGHLGATPGVAVCSQQGNNNYLRL